MKYINNLITPHVNIIFLKIHNLTISEILEKIKFLVLNKTESCRYVFVANLNHLAKIRKNRLLKKVYEEASIVVPDGRYIYWLSRVLGTPLKEYIRGLDLFYALCELAANEKYRLLMVGGKPTAVEISKSILEKKYPGIQICKTYYYPLGSISEQNDLNEKIIKDINTMNIDILFLGLGTPREQEWVYKYKDRIKCVVIGVGSVYDFISRKVKEAPIWMQKIGLEWFFRLIQEPTRLWKRYLIENIAFIFVVLKEVIKTRIFGRKKENV